MARAERILVEGDEVIPLLALIGGGIDVSRAYMAKTQLQSACDAGALAGRRAMSKTGEYGAAEEAKADRMFNVNFRSRRYEPALRAAYFTQLERDMLAPVAANLNQSLFVLPTIPVYRQGEGRRRTDIDIESVEPHARPRDNSPQALADFGNATLGTYLELSRTSRDRVDGELLRQRLPDYWYPAIAAVRQGERDPRDLDYASRQIDFYASQIHATDVPRIDDNAFLISSSRNYIDGLQSRSLRTLETITLEADALFAFGRADLAGLQGAGQHQLNRIAERLSNTADVGRITVTGHADQIGSAETNRRLSLERAQTVRTYLIGRGMAPELIEAEGAGSERPLVECDGNLNRAERIRCLAPNRRVEIEVRALN